MFWGNENSNYAEFKFNGATLGIFQREMILEAIEEAHATDFEKHNAVALIFKVNNVEETYQELKNKVVFITKPTEQKDWGLKVAHFRDPSGTLLEIYENI